MKKFILYATFALLSMITNAQTDVRQIRPEFSQSPTATYRLFPTSNMWIFIKLNTADGRLWLVQYSTDMDNQIEVPLSKTKQVQPANQKNGRFTLYSTQNMYNFLLLDQIDGRVWQVQWSMSGTNNLVIPITP